MPKIQSVSQLVHVQVWLHACIGGQGHFVCMCLRMLLHAAYALELLVVAT